MMSKVILDEVLKYEQPTKYIVESVDYDDNFEVPVLTAGKSFILGYTNETKNIFNDLPIIIFDDFTTSIQFVDFPFKVKSSAMKILKPVKEKADIRYLFYLMQTIKFEAGEHKRYWISKYSQLEVILPPLPIQKAIAEKLDKADALRKKDQELLKYYDELAQSVFIDMFGDPVKNEKGWDIGLLGKVCDVRDGTHDSPKYVLEGYPLITSKNVTGGFISFEDVNFISKTDFDNINKRSKVHIGDIIMPMIGTIGNPVIVNVEPNFAIKNVALIKFNGELSNVLNVYILNLLSNQSYLQKLLSFNKGGTQKFVALGTIRNLEIPIPPLPLQQKFSTIIENIEQQKQKVKLQAEESENLFQALLQESFS